VLDDGEWSVVLLSLRVALASMALLAVPGIAVAWLLARRDFPGKTLVDALVHLPLVLPPVVTGYLLLLLLGRNQPFGAWLYGWSGIALAFTWKGAVVAAAAMAFPLMVRPARLAFALVDPGLEQAAATLGASPWRVFLGVSLPLALPGVAAGLVLAFARSLGEFGATITLAGDIPGESRTLPVAIWTLTQVPGGDARALRLVAVALVISLAALLAAELIDRRLARRLRGA
jgi:molybdate transport system permease protein